ncbi:redox-regulated ATPase YchF [Christensenella intestinihominis]|uniref:redox-regulated ATPase YchF n=1 Tax=Christensenella intestinihominis TaxID=1851429 RepID=UPI00082F8337|nr:redox-regulated ATPase YchF [Christensenella intestinihominis]
MKLGVVGLPNVGKSTLFNALTQAGAQSANYPFCTIEPNYGIVSVPDARMDYLAEIYHPQKFTPAQIEFVDIAGLVKGASKGEGLGNKFLSHIREVDAIIEVVRCFEDDNITHVDGSIDPLRDVTTINYELIFADMETVQKRLDKAVKMQKTGDKKFKLEAGVCETILAELEKGNFARNIEFDEEQAEIMRSMFLLTDKPIIYVGNIAEDQVGRDDLPVLQPLLDYAAEHNSEVVTISAKIEEDLAEMDDEEKALFIEELGIGESGLSKLIKKSYSLLSLISYLTAGEKEVRAWTITRGTKAPQAAGKIHSDFERGFIKAEIIAFDTLKNECNGDMQAAKEKGLVRQEGKEYVIQDGDVVLFRFNV